MQHCFFGDFDHVTRDLVYEAGKRIETDEAFAEFRTDSLFNSLRDFERWEQGEIEIPPGRYFCVLSRDVRKCAVSAISAFIHEPRESSQVRDKQARAVLQHHSLPVELLEKLSWEMRRNIIMCFWCDTEGLTSAKIRDRWYDREWEPKLRRDSEAAAADNVKQFVKRGCEKLKKLADK